MIAKNVKKWIYKGKNSLYFRGEKCFFMAAINQYVRVFSDLLIAGLVEQIQANAQRKGLASKGRIQKGPRGSKMEGASLFEGLKIEEDSKGLNDPKVIKAR